MDHLSKVQKACIIFAQNRKGLFWRILYVKEVLFNVLQKWYRPFVFYLLDLQFFAISKTILSAINDITNGNMNCHKWYFICNYCNINAILIAIITIPIAILIALYGNMIWRKLQCLTSLGSNKLCYTWLQFHDDKWQNIAYLLH